MQTINQPSFGSSQILRESFQYLPKQIRPIVEGEIDRCEPAIKKISRGFKVKIDVKNETPNQLDVFIEKRHLFRPSDSGFMGIPAENVADAKLDFLLKNVVSAFKDSLKIMKKTNSLEKNLNVLLERLSKPMQK